MNGNLDINGLLQFLQQSQQPNLIQQDDGVVQNPFQMLQSIGGLLAQNGGGGGVLSGLLGTSDGVSNRTKMGIKQATEDKPVQQQAPVSETPTYKMENRQQMYDAMPYRDPRTKVPVSEESFRKAPPYIQDLMRREREWRERQRQ